MYEIFRILFLGTLLLIAIAFTALTIYLSVALDAIVIGLWSGVGCATVICTLGTWLLADMIIFYLLRLCRSQHHKKYTLGTGSGGSGGDDSNDPCPTLVHECANGSSLTIFNASPVQMTEKKMGNNIRRVMVNDSIAKISVKMMLNTP